MTCFASRSSGLYSLRPPAILLLSLSLSLPTPARRAHPSRSELPRWGAKGRTTPCLRVRALFPAYMHMHVASLCVCVCAGALVACTACGNARAHVGPRCMHRTLRRRMKNEVRATAFASGCLREGRVFSRPELRAASLGAMNDDTTGNGTGAHLRDF